jgi:hypothetical protein
MKYYTKAYINKNIEGFLKKIKYFFKKEGFLKYGVVDNNSKLNN